MQEKILFLNLQSQPPTAFAQPFEKIGIRGQADPCAEGNNFGVRLGGAGAVADGIGDDHVAADPFVLD